jgi:hypothetical protein
MLYEFYSEFLVVAIQEHFALSSTDRTVLLPDKEFFAETVMTYL